MGVFVYYDHAQGMDTPDVPCFNALYSICYVCRISDGEVAI